jgi:hypothetical protein
MPLIIDGYNLLNAVGIVGRGAGPGGLQRSRLALLNFLAESLEPEEAAHATVVFDAHDAPAGLPRSVEHRGLTVRFAARFEDADSLIEELIRRHSAPRRLTVVSSDHRVQRAARRRKAHFIDSDAWYAEVVRQRHQRQQSAPEGLERPYVPLLEEDVDYWICRFGGESALTALMEKESSGQAPAGGEPPAGAPPAEPTDAFNPPDDTRKDAALLENPFPPGYAEDLSEEADLAEPYNPFPPGYGEDLEELGDGGNSP